MSVDRSAPLLSVCLTAAYGDKPTVLNNVFLQMREGEILGLVGQSGSGKSTLALAILRLLDMKAGSVSGSIYLQGRNLMKLRERHMREVRGKDIGLVLQSPLSSLNPALRIGTQMAEAFRAHDNVSTESCRDVMRQSLREVSLPDDDEFLRRYPSQLSVGQAQRVLIAMAILHRPALIIADEATSALDVITQAEILDLFAGLNQRLGTGILYISHDLLSVASICHRIAILHQGEIVECRPTEDIFGCPEHGYTKRLIAALPRLPELKPARLAR